MISVLVVDDEPIAVRRMRGLLGKIEDVQIVGVAATADAAAACVANLMPDLVLLDIEMPGRSGIQLAGELRLASRAPAIVFVTAFGRFALAAFEVAADHYLLKPVELEQLRTAIDRVRLRLADQRLADRATELQDVVGRLRALDRPEDRSGCHLWLPDTRGRQRVAINEIIWVEAERDYVRVYTERRSYFVRYPIGQLCRELEPHDFLRIHRSILVRRDAVCRVENIGDRSYRLTLATGAALVSSRRFAQVVRRLGAS